MDEYHEIVREVIKHYTTNEQFDVIAQNIDYDDIMSVLRYSEIDINSYNSDTNFSLVKDNLMILGNMFEILDKCYYKYHNIGYKEFNKAESIRLKLNERILLILFYISN